MSLSAMVFNRVDLPVDEQQECQEGKKRNNLGKELLQISFHKASPSSTKLVHWTLPSMKVSTQRAHLELLNATFISY